MSRSEESPLTIGRVVADHYEVTRVLSHGVSGTVYHAEVIAPGDGPAEVALKVLHEGVLADRQLVGRFHREALILKRLGGPHLARLLDFIEEDSLLILVLEYVEGSSLAERLDDHGPLPLATILDIGAQLCAALTTAHQAGVIHRDLKPSNVLLEGWLAGDGTDSELESPKVRVVDFGLAKILHGDQTGTALTETDMVFGTPDYMSPEQVRGDELDVRCDIYALGAMLFEMLVGEVPFPTAGALTTMNAQLNDPVPSPRQAAPERDIPPALEKLVVKAMAKDRDERQPDANALERELEAVAAALEADPSSASGGEGEQSEDDDTLLEPQRLSNPVGTTLKSHRITAHEMTKARGAKVKVLVGEAAPESVDDEPSTRQVAPRRHRLESMPGHDERRFWTVLAVVAAAVAVAVGVWFGVR